MVAMLMVLVSLRQLMLGLTGGPSNLLYVNGTPSKKSLMRKLVDTIEEQVKEQLEKKIL